MPNKPVQATGGAMPEPPEASDVLADFSKMLTLINITTEMVEDVSVKNGDTPAGRAHLINTQNMMHVLWDIAHRLDKDLDAYMARPDALEGKGRNQP